MTVIGKLAPDGSIEVQADECAITGRPVLGFHSVMQHITGTPYFFRYLSDYDHLMTDDKRAELATQIPQEANAPTPLRRGQKPDPIETKETE